MLFDFFNLADTLSGLVANSLSFLLAIDLSSLTLDPAALSELGASLANWGQNSLDFGSSLLVAQLETPDFGAQIQTAWHGFVESGQIWAMIVGFLFGWMIKNFTG